MATETLANKRVAVIDDSADNRERLSDLVVRCCGTPISVDKRAPDINGLKLFYSNNNIDLVICDHHLTQQGDYAKYYGAKAVAESYKLGIGGVLITAYEKSDADHSIRQFRRLIPSLMSHDNLTKDNLQNALLAAGLEARGQKIARDRLPYRTIMTVTKIENRASDTIIKVIMCQWDSKQEVGFPINMLDDSIRSKVYLGTILFANVNIEATRHEDIYFDAFELPNDNVVNRAKTIFGDT